MTKKFSFGSPAFNIIKPGDTPITFGKGGGVLTLTTKSRQPLTSKASVFLQKKAV